MKERTMKRILICLTSLCIPCTVALAADPAPTGTTYKVEVKVLSVAAGELRTNSAMVTADALTMGANGQWSLQGRTYSPGGLLEKLEKADGVDVLSAPQIVTRAGQEARVEIIRQVAYMVPETNVLYRVRGHWFSDDTVEAISNGLYRMETLDEELNPGISVTITVTPADGDAVNSNVKFRYNLLAEMTALPGTEIKMGRPLIESRKIETSIAAKQGEWLVFGGAQKVLNKATIRDAHPILPLISSTKRITREEDLLVFLRVTATSP
jgi:type II secretory pathway component GspD/PulD (secretin)